MFLKKDERENKKADVSIKQKLHTQECEFKSI